ncbi:hypothetical protein QMK17_22955 [Rhodococcus sp. G-MC3]|uniref:hypothetical protein n=1 Tax=Rhodococcus sp. G-MC3 TaxID=3046209 RepID=UPI0024BB95E8|nr:hypothetical protein [Rhodococcus sp. G-MC3]MDJ0396182.1 hypothetical protein [Rhodococcus sp. G-MC3]
MIGLIVVAVVFTAALAHAGASESGWHFAPLRATRLVVMWSFKLVVALVALTLALVFGVASSALRSSF